MPLLTTNVGEEDRTPTKAGNPICVLGPFAVASAVWRLGNNPPSGGRKEARVLTKGGPNCLLGSGAGASAFLYRRVQVHSGFWRLGTPSVFGLNGLAPLAPQQTPPVVVISGPKPLSPVTQSRVEYKSLRFPRLADEARTDTSRNASKLSVSPMFGLAFSTDDPALAGVTRDAASLLAFVLSPRGRENIGESPPNIPAPLGARASSPTYPYSLRLNVGRYID